MFTLLLLLSACVHDPEPAAPVASPAPVAAAGEAAAKAPTAEEEASTDADRPNGFLPPLPVGPARDPGFSMPVSARIEGPTTAGECSADADCAMAGCSHEVCVAAPNAGRIVTTCEVLPAFDDLKSCTCQSGECRWVHEPGARGLLKPGVILPR